MSWSGSGVFNRLYSWVADKNAGINITASRMDADTNDITTNGFGNCLTRDGQGAPVSNLPMGGFLHNNVGAGATRTDYARLDQVQDGVSLNWTIAGGSADALTATFTPAITALVDGQFCCVRAAAANATTTPTFAPNGLTAHTITKSGGTALAAGDIPGNFAEIILRYNLANTRWELLNPVPSSAAGSLTPTGSIFDYIGAAAPAGYILAVGNSIGDAASGATERANADTATLFALIWNSANIASGEGQVQDSSGSNVARGVSAAADFAAHRRILVPNYSDRTSRGKSGSTNLGDTGGSDTASIAQANLPNVNFTVTGNVDITDPQHTHGVSTGAFYTAGGAGVGLAFGGNFFFSPATISVGSTGITASLSATTAASGGSGTALAIKPKFIVQTKIIKL